MYTEDSLGCGYTPGESIPRGELCETLTLYNIRVYYHNPLSRQWWCSRGGSRGCDRWCRANDEGLARDAEKFSCRRTPVAGTGSEARTTVRVRMSVDEEGGERNVYIYVCPA